MIKDARATQRHPRFVPIEWSYLGKWIDVEVRLHTRALSADMRCRVRRPISHAKRMEVHMFFHLRAVLWG